MVERDCGTGDPYRGSGWHPWVNRVLCGVLDRGGVLERARRGVPPIGAVKSEGSAGGGGFSPPLVPGSTRHTANCLDWVVCWQQR